MDTSEAPPATPRRGPGWPAILALIGTVVTVAPALLTGVISSYGNERDETRLRIEQQDMIRQKYVDRVVSAGQSPEERLRILRLLYHLDEDKVLQGWARAELELAEIEVKKLQNEIEAKNAELATKQAEVDAFAEEVRQLRASGAPDAKAGRVLQAKELELTDAAAAAAQFKAQAQALKQELTAGAGTGSIAVVTPLADTKIDVYYLQDDANVTARATALRDALVKAGVTSRPVVLAPKGRAFFEETSSGGMPTVGEVRYEPGTEELVATSLQSLLQTLTVETFALRPVRTYTPGTLSVYVVR
ncbi:MAG: hypothetical protein Q8P41_02065 [Pseudomonadota bacterium]|nr:hypothetical protein [Pseudomonadota bacterium]